MSQISVYTGPGRGKTPAAIGEAILRAAKGENVVIIQYLKGKGFTESEFLNRLEPEIKLFRFEKSVGNYEDLSEEKKNEEISNIKNGVNFARKVLTTGGCDLLILDEILGIVDNGILSGDELREMLESRDEGVDVILTGINFCDDILALADNISTIS